MRVQLTYKSVETNELIYPTIKDGKIIYTTLTNIPDGKKHFVLEAIDEKNNERNFLLENILSFKEIEDN